MTTAQNRWIQDAPRRRHDGRRAVPGQPAPRGDVPHRSRDPRARCCRRRSPRRRSRACACTSPASRSTATCTRSCARSCSTRCTATSVGQFCAVMPIDLETAVSPSRETYGEPKKLAQLEFEREGDHVKASVTRQGVTIIEVVGDVTDELPVPAPYEVRAVLVQVPARGVGRGLRRRAVPRHAAPDDEAARRARRSTASSCCATSPARRWPTCPCSSWRAHALDDDVQTDSTTCSKTSRSTPSQYARARERAVHLTLRRGDQLRSLASRRRTSRYSHTSVTISPNAPYHSMYFGAPLFDAWLMNS